MTDLLQATAFADTTAILSPDLYTSGLAQHLAVDDADLPEFAALTLKQQDRDERARRIKDLLDRANKLKTEEERAPLLSELARLQGEVETLNGEVQQLQARLQATRTLHLEQALFASVQRLYDHAQERAGAQPLDALIAAWAGLSVARQIAPTLTLGDLRQALLGLDSALLQVILQTLQAQPSEAWFEATAEARALNQRSADADACLLDARRQIDALALPTQDGWEGRLSLIPNAIEVLQRAQEQLRSLQAEVAVSLRSPAALHLLLLPAFPERADALDAAITAPLRAWSAALAQTPSRIAPAALAASLLGLEAALPAREADADALQRKLQDATFVLNVGHNLAALAALVPPLRDQHDAFRHDLETLPRLDPSVERPQALVKLDRLIALHAWADAGQVPLQRLTERLEHANTRAFRKHLAERSAALGFTGMEDRLDALRHAFTIADLYKKLEGQAAAQLKGLLDAVEPALEDDAAWDPAWEDARKRVPADALNAILTSLDAEEEKITSKLFGLFKSKDSKNINQRKQRFEAVIDAAARQNSPILSYIVALDAVTLPEVP